MKFEIKNRCSREVQVTAEIECSEDAAYSVKLGLAVKWAIKADAYLARANLAGANLAGADGKKLALVGKRPVTTYGPFGSRCATLTAFNTDAGVYVRAGCFWNTLEAFKAAVQVEHGDNVHGREYRALIALIELHAAEWPAESVATTEAA